MILIILGNSLEHWLLHCEGMLNFRFDAELVIYVTSKLSVRRCNELKIQARSIADYQSFDPVGEQSTEAAGYLPAAKNFDTNYVEASIYRLALW